MIRLETINFLILIITGLLAYIPTITFSGFFSAWLADKIGDDTARNQGLVTLNPINHIDLFYMLLSSLFIPLGFARPIPVNIDNLNPMIKFRNLRIISLFFIDAIGYLIFLTISVFIMKLFSISLLNINDSVFSVVIMRFFKMVFVLTIFFIIINFVWGFIKTITHFYFPELQKSSYYFIFISLLFIILMILFGSYIEYFILLYKLNLDKLFNFLFIK